jgi:CheY-like chemotaxis protein
MSALADVSDNKVLEKKKIVVIDDEPMTRMIINASLKNDMDVCLVSNVSEALVICEKELPDFILLDLYIPQIDGFEMLQLLKHNTALCDIPVICMSATYSAEVRERIHKAGAAGFINKPIVKKTLSRDIHNIMESMNNSLYSKNRRVVFEVCYNDLELEKKILTSLMASLQANEKVVYMSWEHGEDFVSNNYVLKKYIDTEQLVFLEIKPNLISKFPYMQDLSSLLLDITQFLKSSTRDYHLIIEEPRQLLNVAYKDKTISQAYKVGFLFNGSFRNVSYINTKPHTDEDQLFLQKIGRILTGVKS